MDIAVDRTKKQVVEKTIGFILLAVLLLSGVSVLPDNALYFRLIMGLAFGYTLSRAYTGFAGSINRAYKFGSTQLMRTMMLMFVMTAVTTFGILVFTEDISAYTLWINPINLGLLAGGLLFGFGMSFSSCCATGVMTDLVTDLPRAGVTTIFFMLGVFLGFPLQSTQTWVSKSWFTSETGKLFSQGVFLPDFFKWDGLNGYLGALILTIILAAIVVFASYKYEQHRKKSHTYHGVLSERAQAKQEQMDIENFSLKNQSTYDYIFKKPWTLQQGAFILTILFLLLMVATKSGWGASTPYGIWFGKLLTVFGVSAESVASFTHQSAETFSAPFLANGVTVQNLGIIFGALLYVLTSGMFMETLRGFTHLDGKHVFFYGLGGLTMGFGTRLANGCNVGALYSPIAQFSLSGWIFLIVLVIGGIIGNRVAQRANFS